MVNTISHIYRKIRSQLLLKEDEYTATLYARNLVCHFAGITKEKLLAEGNMPVSEELTNEIEAALGRILGGEPLAYVLGQWEFYGMTLSVNNNVLIPRDDTCAVADLAIKQSLFLDTTPRIMDLCTGTGCIGLAIASRVKDAKVTLADISREALAVAKKNVTDLKMSARVSCVVADAMGEPPAYLGKFDLIVSNPPYITEKDMEELPHSVKAFEPHLALFGGTDGLDFYRNITEKYKEALKPGGFLCFEFGMGQGDDVCAILNTNGFKVLERVKDYNDIERAVLARYDRKED